MPEVEQSEIFTVFLLARSFLLLPRGGISYVVLRIFFMSLLAPLSESFTVLPTRATCSQPPSHLCQARIYLSNQQVSQSTKATPHLIFTVAYDLLYIQDNSNFNGSA